MQKDCTVVLSLYPNTRGLGFACLMLPKKLLDSGIVSVRPICNNKLSGRIFKFLEYYRPTILVLRGYDKPATLRGKRIQALLETISTFALQKNIPFHTYSRSQIRDTFEFFGARTKLEIVQKIVEWIPDLEKRAPKLKAWYEPEDYHMGVFNALSLCFCHQYLTE